METARIPGYRMGDADLSPGRLDAAAFEQLCSVALFTDEDRAALRDAAIIVGPRVEDLLDVWYDFVGSHPFLLEAFSTPEGPDADYLSRVRERFGQWVRDTLQADFDDAWLAYQAEVGRRHASGKNETDSVQGAPSAVPFRHVVALIVPIHLTMRGFLAAGASDEGHLDRMHTAWLKAVVLNVAVWSQEYVDASTY